MSTMSARRPRARPPRRAGQAFFRFFDSHDAMKKTKRKTRLLDAHIAQKYALQPGRA
jgi:hypothetical protein